MAQAARVSGIKTTELIKARDRLSERLGAMGAELQDSLRVSLASELAGLEGQIRQEEVRVETLAEATPEELFALEEIQRSSGLRLGPSLRLTVVSAVVLGICAGVLLTFFVHSLATVRETAKSDVGN